MPKFATLDPKFSNISIVKNKVPWVEKLFQDIKNKLKKRGFWNSFILLCHLCSKLWKFQLFTKCKGRRRGRATTYTYKSPFSLCYTRKINLGGFDFRFKITEVLEQINGWENKKKKMTKCISPFSRKVPLWIEISLFPHFSVIWRSQCLKFHVYLHNKVSWISIGDWYECSKSSPITVWLVRNSFQQCLYFFFTCLKYWHTDREPLHNLWNKKVTRFAQSLDINITYVVSQLSFHLDTYFYSMHHFSFTLFKVQINLVKYNNSENESCLFNFYWFPIYLHFFF